MSTFESDEHSTPIEGPCISTAYFPELLEKISGFASISEAYEVWMLGAAQRRIDKVGAVTEGHREAMSTYLAGRSVEHGLGAQRKYQPNPDEVARRFAVHRA